MLAVIYLCEDKPLTFALHPHFRVQTICPGRSVQPLLLGFLAALTSVDIEFAHHTSRSTFAHKWGAGRYVIGNTVDDLASLVANAVRVLLAAPVAPFSRL